MSVVVFLPLSQGKVAVIDFDDFEKVGRFKWFAHASGKLFYAARNSRVFEKRIRRFLHIELLGFKGVDHKNGDSLDNRRENLRPATQAKNVQNSSKRGGTSKFKGVCFRKGRWISQIGANGKKIHIGCFVDELTAALAYDQAAIKYFGEFARLNCP